MGVPLATDDSTRLRAVGVASDGATIQVDVVQGADVRGFRILRNGRAVGELLKDREGVMLSQTLKPELRVLAFEIASSLPNLAGDGAAEGAERPYYAYSFSCWNTINNVCYWTLVGALVIDATIVGIVAGEIAGSIFVAYGWHPDVLFLAKKAVSAVVGLTVTQASYVLASSCAGFADAVAPLVCDDGTCAYDPYCGSDGGSGGSGSGSGDGGGGYGSGPGCGDCTSDPGCFCDYVCDDFEDCCDNCDFCGC
jgi:hypothetical protein